MFNPNCYLVCVRDAILICLGLLLTQESLLLWLWKGGGGGGGGGGGEGGGGGKAEKGRGEPCACLRWL